MARDKLHVSVREALIKQGWHITHDPLRIPIDGTFLDIDIAAEAVLAAEKDNEKIAVEVKGFIGKSFINEFHSAMGQYLDYKSALADYDPTRTVYLALPTTAQKHPLFYGKFVQKRFREEEVKIIIVDSIENEIKEWIKY